MTSRNIIRRARLGTALAALAIGYAPVVGSSPAAAQSQPSYRPSGQVIRLRSFAASAEQARSRPFAAPARHAGPTGTP